MNSEFLRGRDQTGFYLNGYDESYSTYASKTMKNKKKEKQLHFHHPGIIGPRTKKSRKTIEHLENHKKSLVLFSKTYINKISNLEDAIEKLRIAEDTFKSSFELVFFTMAPKKRTQFMNIIKLTLNVIYFINNNYKIHTTVLSEFKKFKISLKKTLKAIQERQNNSVTSTEIATVSKIVSDTLEKIVNY